MSPVTCRSFTPSKHVVCKADKMKVLASWQLKTWGQAQAGNRASRTGLYMQWRDTEAEWHKMTPAGQKPHHSSFFLLPSLR